MERASRSELIQTIEEQKGKLDKYTNKLRDVVQAYKGLVKEKEALEASVKALSTAAPIKTGKDESKGKKEGKAKQNNESINDPLNVSNLSEGGDEEESEEREDVQQLKQQLATLTSSLATVSQEKSKMEATYLSEKKKIKLENEEYMKNLEAKKKDQETLATDLSKQLSELKARVRNQQHEREKEQNDHAMMLRELQKLLGDERIAREQLEHQLDDAKQAIFDRPVVPDVSPQYEKKISDLKIEIESLKKKLRETESKASQPSSLLIQLQRESAELKAQLRLATQQEQRKGMDSDQQLREMGKNHEEHVSSLESKLSELSEEVGNYEKLRFADQTVIQKLKSRVAQLDFENSALARAASSGGNAASGTDESNLNVEDLVDKITKFKGLLKLANAKAERPINIEEIFGSNLTDIYDKDIHLKCEEEYQQLKEDFERYKLRAQSLLKSKGTKDTGNKEIDTLKSQVTELRERLRLAHLDYEQQEETNKTKEQDYCRTITSLDKKHKEELSLMEGGHKQKVNDLEVEIKRHRERTIALLSEKDKEIEYLKSKSGDRYEMEYGNSFRRLSSQESDISEVGAASSEDQSAVGQLLHRTSLLGGTPGETSLLHFAQEQARKDVEINALRKQKRSLESALRDLQFLSSSKEEKYTDQIDFLKEEVRKLERNKSRESANLEYLKNVVYHFMVCTDSTGKQQMLNAISTILEFSPKEKQASISNLSKGWWGSYTKSAYAASKTTKL